MEPDRKYLLVGIFVVALVIGVLGFIVWLAGSDSGHYETYQTFASESVNGLSVGSAVKYRGVDVGKVTIIEIARSNPGKIRIQMDILGNTPVTTSTVAMLQLQGITGISYIELKGKIEKNQPKIGLKGNNKIPVIPSAPSEFRQIVDTVPDMLQKFTELADKLGTFVNEDNRQSFTNILQNLENFSTQVGSENENGHTLISELQQATRQLGEAASSIGTIASESRDDTQRILRATIETMEKINALADDASQYGQRGFTEMNQLLMEIKKTAREFQNLSRNLKENPSQLIFPAQESGQNAY